MNVLVLGGSVFVGRRLVNMLLRGGHEVSVLNRGQTTVAFEGPVTRLVADRTKTLEMAAALRGREWDCVFDVSGFVMASGGSDIDGLLDLLDGHTNRYVYVSSIMAYDQSSVGIFPWTEDLGWNGDGPASYGGFKASTEQALLARNKATGFPAVVVRPAAIYGPNNNIFDMETPMFLRLLRERPILVPHGGLVVGSYGHVDDLCDAMTVCASHPRSVGEIFNITTSSCDVNHYIATLARVVGVDPVVVPVPDSLIDSFAVQVYGHLFKVRHHAMLSTTKAESLLGVSPRYNLFDGHKHTYEWFTDQGMASTQHSLSDPTWRSSWDFAAEDAAVEALRRA
jgi:nucleoside-diphosphate-sugar epimerase